MNTIITPIQETDKVSEPLNLLLVGNNPMELGNILDKIQHVANSQNIITEIAFDLRSLLERLVKFTPNFILIDDNIGKGSMFEAIRTLANNIKTKDIPVTVIKNSNYEESLGSSSVLDYVLKQNLSVDSLLKSLKNALKIRQKQLNLYKAYQLRKKQAESII